MNILLTGAGVSVCFLAPLLFQNKINARKTTINNIPVVTTFLSSEELVIYQSTASWQSPTWIKLWAKNQTITMQPVYAITATTTQHLNWQQVGTVPTLQPTENYVGSFVAGNFPPEVEAMPGFCYIKSPFDRKHEDYQSGNYIQTQYPNAAWALNISPGTLYLCQQWQAPAQHSLYYLGYQKHNFMFSKFSSCPQALRQSEMDDDNTIGFCRFGQILSLSVGVLAIFMALASK